MKGLFIKDIRLLISQKNYFCTILILGLIIAIFTQSPFFTIYYIPFSFSTFTSSTISYDQYENGYTFLFSLPVSRKEYVKEKYYYSFFIIGLSAIITLLLVIILNIILKPSFDFETIVSSSFIYLGLIYSQMLMIPLQFQFGSEKLRTIMVGTFALIGAFCFMLLKCFEYFKIDLESILNQLLSMNTFIFILVLVLISCLALWVSYQRSLAILNKKEF